MSDKTFETRLIEIARTIDRGDGRAAKALLVGTPIGPYDAPSRKLFLALVGRVLKFEIPNAAAATTPLLRRVDRVVDAPGDIWNVDLPLRDLEQLAGSEIASAVVAVALWPDVLRADRRFFTRFIELVCRGGQHDNAATAWRAFLAVRDDYVPGHWTTLAVVRGRGLQSLADLRDEVLGELRASRREDLCPLVEIQLDFIRQRPVAATCEKALALRSPEHRQAVAHYLLGAAFMADEAEGIERAFLELAPEDEHAGARRDLMRARVETAHENWSDALASAEKVAAPADLRLIALALIANAKMRLARHPEARKDIGEILDHPGAPPFLRGRAMLISAIGRQLEAGRPGPEQAGSAAFPVIAGRPLAQSLWVGPRLRWVEQLSIKSYLRNGWRYQLYVYDLPENVPEGCEVRDAEAILPRAALFREGGRSGVHAGSLGAFSDLFRYALLALRGGMWTDTDVINLRRFEPDGQSFISTELNDAGIYGPNGALMAAPAGSAFMTEAMTRARAILDAGELTFARIGPELLAEMIGENGPGDFRLLPRSFMNPIPWLRASMLLDDFERISAMPEIAAAHNVHLYTETWRLIGLSLDSPPAPDSYLGRLHADILGAGSSEAGAV